MKERSVYLSVNGQATDDDAKFVRKLLTDMNLKVVQWTPGSTYDSSIYSGSDFMVAIPAPYNYGDRDYMWITGKGQYSELHSFEGDIFVWDRRACTFREITDTMILDEKNWQKYGILELDEDYYESSEMYEAVYGEYPDNHMISMKQEAKLPDDIMDYGSNSLKYHPKSTSSTSVLGRPRKRRFID